MSRTESRVECIVFCVVACLALATSAHAQAVRTWIGGNNDWIEGAANNANWSGSDEPDQDDTAVFNTSNTVDLGSANTIAALTLSGGIDLSLNGNDLIVAGPTTIGGASTNFNVAGVGALLTGQTIAINSGGQLFLDGGAVDLAAPGVAAASLSTATGGVLSGNGTVTFTEGLVGVTTLLNNNGSITASNPALSIVTPPAAATLTLATASSSARIDLDGSAETGSVSVNRNQTLAISRPLADAFHGAIDMSHNTKLDITNAWTLAGGTLNADNGAVIGLPAIAAGTAIIDGGAFTQSGGTITVEDADGTLQFDAPFSMTAGSFINNGHVIFNANSAINLGVNFTMPTASSSLSVGANRTVNIAQANFNIDGANTLTNIINVEAGGRLLISTTDYDPDQATNAFDGTTTLNSGQIDFATSDAEFVMDGVLNMNNITGFDATWTGEPVDIGNDAGVIDADINVGGTGNSSFVAPVDFNSDADVNVLAGATLRFIEVVNFDTVNGANNADFTGSGEIAFNGVVNVNEAVTFDMTGGAVDLDGTDSDGNFINIDAPFVINTETMRAFGNSNTVGVNTLDINSLVGTGVLTVNLDDANAEWTLNAAGVMNLVNDGGGGTLLTGSDVNLDGTVNVTGAVGISARVDIAGTINVAMLSGLTLTGSSAADPNRLVGGTINGPGGFSVASLRGLRGFGTINPSVNYAGSAELLADDGELTLNGAINDVGKIGTADADGVLNVVNAWNSSGADNVVLVGGELKGGAVTVGNANGIQGHGLISARVVNNTRLQADTGALVIETAANDNDWDGAGGTGQLHAIAGNTLELRDTAQFNFTGSATATGNSRIFANGFGLNFEPGSSLNLTGSTFQANRGSNVGGAVNVAAGAESTIDVEANFFLTLESTSATTLNSNLQLVNNNINIEAGATFSGPGALIIPDSSHFTADNGADIDVLLDNQGSFRPAGFNAVGRVDVKDYQQADTGELFVELTGTSLNQFDRVVVGGDVLLDGYLNIDIDGVFVPALGNTFNIISANTLSGQFDNVDVSGMPSGLTFHLNYLSNAVQLQVVSTPFFSADFDNDGDVDATDLIIWRNNFDLNQLGDADGDNDSDGNDFLLWQRQLGSVPSAVTASAIPEPSAAKIAAAGAAIAATTTFRRRPPTQRRPQV